MPQSLARVLAHLVFSTRNRARLIKPEFERELFGYIHGIIENNGAKLFIAGGVEDHVHLLVSLGRTVSIGELVGDIKRDSSKWMNAKCRSFYWQNGYGAFSVSESNVESVIRYIKDQKRHHQRFGFQDEYRSLMKKHRLEIDERYCWD